MSSKKAKSPKKSKSSSSDKKSKKEKGSSESKSSKEKKSSHSAGGGGVSSDFEADFVFTKYDSLGKGYLNSTDFLAFYREYKNRSPLPKPTSSEGIELAKATESFEAGNLFAKYDKNHEGKLSKEAFGTFAKAHHDYVRLVFEGLVPPPQPQTENKPPDNSLPLEVVTGKLLTHYDETAGVAIPSRAAEQHRALGNRVLPLMESYKYRYERLRKHLTGRLLPRRELLLQQRRQLEVCLEEISAVRKTIEKETITDCDEVLERLKNAEQNKRSAIQYEEMKVVEELQAIERVIRRVEVANADHLMPSKAAKEPRVPPSHPNALSDWEYALLTSANPGPAPPDPADGPRAACMVELIQQYGDLTSHIETLASKVLTVKVDFPTTDLPKETTERKEVVRRCDNFVEALKVKDQMLLAAMKEAEKGRDAFEEERKLNSAYTSELSNWAEMANSLSDQVNSLKKEKDSLARRNAELIGILREHNIHYVMDA